MKKLLLLSVLSLLAASCVSIPQYYYTANAKFDVLNISAEKSPAGCFITTSRAWAKNQTEVIVKAEDKGLHLEFLCSGNPENTVFSPKKADDDMTLFGGEHIEIQLAPDHFTDRRYFHFAVNPAGSVYHAVRHDTSWNPANFSCKITDFKGYRRYIIEIPWSTFDLKKKPSDGTVWKANFCRGAKMKNSPTEFSSWSGANSYHDLTQMGDLVFGGQKTPQLRIFSQKITDSTFECSVTAADAGKCDLQIFFNNILLTEMPVDGGNVNFKCRLPDRYIPLKGIEQITYRLIKGDLIIREKSALNPAKTADLLSLDQFEYPLNSVLKCTVSAVPGKFTVKNDSKVLIEENISQKSAAISLDSLPPGRYVAQYSFNNNHTDRVFFIRNKTPYAKILPPKAKLTAVNENLLLDGEPFYLLGISWTPKTYYPQNPGFTLRYGKGARENAFGYQGIPGKKLVRKPFTGYAFSYDWQQKIAKHYSQQRQSGSRAWRTLCYEANLPVFFTQKDGTLKHDPEGHTVYAQIYKMAKNTMPDSLFSIHVDSMPALAKYVNYCDVMEFSSWRSSYHHSNLLLFQTEDLQYVRKHLGKKPIVMWLGGSIPSHKNRIAEEIRAGVYNTIINNGAGNIIHMGHSGVPSNRTRFWSMLSILQREVDSFYGDLQKAKPCEIDLPENFAGKAGITSDGNLLAVILNKSTFSRTFKLAIPGYQTQTLYFTPLEPRVVRLQKK